MEKHVKINITVLMIKEFGFRTILSPYQFTPQRRIYEAEYYSIHDALKSLNINPLNVKNFMYECGLFKPYMIRDLPTSTADGYIIHFLVDVSGVVPTKTLKENIRDMFITAKSLKIKKEIYKDLIKEYHPDKGGNLEIAQFINSFKTW
jgi:hypothetical protein